jgi:hypothetical protein
MRSGAACRLGFGLSRELWFVELGIFLNYFGYGAVLPFEVIYLHTAAGSAWASPGSSSARSTGSRS